MIQFRQMLLSDFCRLNQTWLSWSLWYSLAFLTQALLLKIPSIKFQWIEDLEDHTVRQKGRCDGHSSVGCEPPSSETLASTHWGRISFPIFLTGGWYSISHLWILPTFNYLIPLSLGFFDQFLWYISIYILCVEVNLPKAHLIKSFKESQADPQIESRFRNMKLRIGDELHESLSHAARHRIWIIWTIYPGIIFVPFLCRCRRFVRRFVDICPRSFNAHFEICSTF